MSSKSILLIIADVIIAGVLIRILFKNARSFFRSIYFYLYPDILSIIQRKYHRDFAYTHRLLFFILIMTAIVFLEVKLFY